MNLLVTELSKYMMLICLWIYIMESFLGLVRPNGDKKTGRFSRQYIYIFMIHTLGMVTLFLESDQYGYLILYGVQAGVLFLVSRLAILLYRGMNRMIINHMCLLLSIGFVIQSRLSFDKSVRQFKIIAISLILFLIIPFIIRKWHWIKDLWILYATVGIVALSAVWILGKTVNGSKLSFQIAGLTFQPSEFVKILFVFFIAGILYKINHLGRIALSATLAAIYVLTLVASKDLGSALIFYCVYIAMLYCSTGKIFYLISGILGGGLAAVIAYRIFSHVQLRVNIWMNPWEDLNDSGYQLTQSLFAIGTGGWLGSGLMKGSPNSIPYVEEDFVFSAIAEELGVFFAITFILLCLCIFIQFLQFALSVKDNFFRLVASGIATAYGVQVVLTIGGGTRFIPLTGVTLPLVSSGGSSAMSTILMFAIMSGISLIKEDETEKEYNEFTDFFDEEGYLYEDMEEEYNALEKALRKRKNSLLIQSILMTFVFAGMIGNLIYYMHNDAHQAINNEYNAKRQEQLAAENLRGTIYSQDGQILAQTLVLEDGTEMRNYPYANMFCHAVGYASNGKAGVEASENIYLIQSNTSLSDRVSNEMQNQKNPGDNVYTTLRVDLQQIAYDSLGVYRGAVIVTEAKTGRILAMVSKPDFDPNEIDKNWEEYLSNEESSVLLNRVTSGLYPPGSTFKIFTALEYIREHPNNYQEYHYNCIGYHQVGEERINCYHGSVHGSLDLYTSFAKSCNSSFANIGMLLDRERFADTLLSMLFNTDLPVSFTHRQSHISMRESMTNAEIMQSAIGQGETLITPLHLNMVTQAIANGGDLYIPYLVDRVENADGVLVKQYNPTLYRSLITAQEAEILTEMMIQVVENGTASKLSNQSYTAAGKTGSAEYSSVKGQSHAWFTGFAPANDPEIVVTVILEGAGSGGDYAAPIARRIFSQYFN